MRLSATAASLLLLVASAASAQLSELTPFVGYQGGGVVELDEEDTGMNSSMAFGVMLTFDRGRGRKFDLVLSDQGTRAERQDPFEPRLSVDVSLQYFQIGGRYFWDPDRRVAPYVAATGGGMYIRVGSAEGAYLSFALGGGADIQLNSRMALRLDGRFYTALVGSRVEIACDSSGQCSGMADGSQFNQLIVSTGIVFKF
jgi:opacity protein-like surface antigen